MRRGERRRGGGEGSQTCYFSHITRREAPGVRRGGGHACFCSHITRREAPGGEGDGRGGGGG